MSLIVPVPIDAAHGWVLGKLAHSDLVNLWRKVDVSKPFAVQIVTWTPGFRGNRSFGRQLNFWFLNPNCRVAVAYMHTEMTARFALRYGWLPVKDCPSRTDGIFMAKENRTG